MNLGFYKSRGWAYGLIAVCFWVSSAFASPLNYTHTHTSTLELKPIPQAQNDMAFKTAAIYFLPDVGDSDYSNYSYINSNHNQGACEKRGYIYTSSNCAAPRILKTVCPFGQYYLECYCAGSPTCTGTTSRQSNPYPSSTGASESSCKNCKNDTLHSWQCSSSACSSYNISGRCPANGSCSRCCDGYYKLDSCNSGYEKVGSGNSVSCVLSETCFGETSANNALGYSCTSCTTKSSQTLYTCSCTGSCSLSSCPDKGSCTQDCRGKYCLNSCQNGYSVNGGACTKDCVPNDCSSYPLYTIPTNADYDSCSVGCGSSVTRYSFKQCNLGYIETDQTCNKCNKTETSCSSDKTLVNTCTDTSGEAVGDCVDCANNVDLKHPCAGKKKCSSDTGSGLCECGDQKFYDDCSCSLSNCPSNGTCTKSSNNKYCLDGCDSGYRKSGDTCVCVPDSCSGYNLSTPPANATYETCAPGCGLSTKYKITSCDSGYVRNGDTCTCTPNDCSAYPLYIQPANASFETCSQGCGLPSKYRIKSCNAGYYTEGEGCTKCSKPNGSCDTGKTLVNTCSLANGSTVGDCVDCRDESSPYNPCYGYYICEGSKVGDGATCNCGSQTYHQRCLVPETCLYTNLKDSTCPSGLRYRNSNSCIELGWYARGKTCTALDSKTYWENRSFCNSGYDDAPCKGFKSDSDCKGAGGFDTTSEKCSCGGEVYYKSCKDTCIFNYLKDSTCPSGLRNRENNSCVALGWYAKGSTCTALDGKTYWEDYGLCANGASAPCYGFKRADECKAAGGFDTTSEKCSCGGEDLYKSCKDSCTYKYSKDSTCPSGLRYRNSNSCIELGWYAKGSTCTALDGKTYWEDQGLCGNGASAPCYGFKRPDECPEKIVGGDTCSCGGTTLGSVCLTICNYEDTPSTCSTQGKSFILKCSDENGNQFGECT